jgi:hypothetical protein
MYSSNTQNNMCVSKDIDSILARTMQYFGETIKNAS